MKRESQKQKRIINQHELSESYWFSLTKATCYISFFEV